MECDPDQVALCYIEHGQKRSICRRPPASRNARIVIYWLYGVITGHPVTRFYTMSSADLKMMLSGVFVRVGGIKVNFSVPSFIRDMLDKWDRESGEGGGGISSPVRPAGPGSRPGRRYRDEGEMRKAGLKKSAIRNVIGKKLTSN